MSTVTSVRPRVATPPRQRVRRSFGWLPAGAVAAAGIALAAIVGADGSLEWQLGRAIVVLAATIIGYDAARRRGVARSVAALLLGLPALVVGAAIGVPHAAAGVSIMSVAGVVALLAGLVLVAVAFAGAWGATRWWGRVGVIAVALVLAQFVVFPVSVAVFTTNRIPTPPPSVSPADVGLDYRDVLLPDTNGVTLSAWYVPSRNGAAVVLRHGSGSTRAAVLSHAAVLADHGYGVLLTDARGHGGSGGSEMDFGWHGDADIAAAMSYLTAAPDVMQGRIGVVGMSMGGEEAIGAAASTPAIRAVVAEGASGRTGTDWLALQPDGIGRWFSTAFYGVQDTAAELLSGARRPASLVTAVSAADQPLLIIAAGTDDRERAAARLLAQAAPARVEVWEVAGAGHIAGLATAEDEWQRRVVDFLDNALGVNSAP